MGRKHGREWELHAYPVNTGDKNHSRHSTSKAEEGSDWCRWWVTLWTAYLCTVVTYNVSNRLGGDEVMKAVVQCQRVALQQEQEVRTVQRSCWGTGSLPGLCPQCTGIGLRHTGSTQPLLTGSGEGWELGTRHPHRLRRGVGTGHPHRLMRGGNWHPHRLSRGGVVGTGTHTGSGEGQS